MQTEKCHTQPPITNPNSFSKGREVNIAIPPLAVTGYLTFLRKDMALTISLTGATMSYAATLLDLGSETRLIADQPMTMALGRIDHHAGTYADMGLCAALVQHGRALTDAARIQIPRALSLPRRDARGHRAFHAAR